jgi:hypothetical protein
MKICPKCKRDLPLSGYTRNKHRKDGLCFSCRECMHAYLLKYKDKAYHITKERHKRYREKNRESILKRTRDWNIDHKDEIREYKRVWIANKLNEDINYKISQAIRHRIYLAFKENSISKRTVFLLGCSIEELKHHLESLFLPGMSWENWGRGQNCWHIDHIMPLSMFDLTVEEQLLTACHYKNLQPLWEFDNLSKGAKYEAI